jgi:hypothetical protein
LTQAQRDEARRRALAGEPCAAVAESIGCSAERVRQLARAPAPAAPAPPAGDLVADLRRLADDLSFDPDRAGLVQRAIDALTAAEDDDHDPIGDLPDGLSAAETASELLGRLRLAHRRAESVGDVRGAGYAARTIASVLPAAARLARQAQEDGDMIRIPRAEFEAGQAAYRERVAAIVARPLTCARCGAILRAEAAGVELAPAAPPAGAM